MNLILSVFLIGNLTVTAYRSLPEQTDDSPFITSIGERVNNHGVAISQDLLRSGAVNYGDLLYIEGVGFRVVNDCMNARHRKRVDVWVASKDEEHNIGVHRRQVFLIRRTLSGQVQSTKQTWQRTIDVLGIRISESFRREP